jgi:hypothetical protein
MKKVRATELNDENLSNTVVFVENVHHNHSSYKKNLINESGVVSKIDGDQCYIFFRNGEEAWFNKKRLEAIKFDKTRKYNNLGDSPEGIYLEESGGYPKFIKFNPDKDYSKVYSWSRDSLSESFTGTLIQLSNEKSRVYYKINGLESEWKMIVNQDFSSY